MMWYVGMGVWVAIVMWYVGSHSDGDVGIHSDGDVGSHRDVVCG